MKTINLTLFGILLSLKCLGQISNANLIAHYPLNGNGNDISGNSFNASLTGSSGYVPDRNGNPNSAFQFNGIDSYFLINNVNSTFKPTTFPVTISAWVKLAVENQKLFHVFKNDFAYEIYSGLRVTILPNGRVECSIEDGGPIGAGSRRSKAGNSNIKDNKWHLITCIIRGTTNMDIYVDCTNDGGTYSGTGDALAYGSGRPGILGALDGLLNNTNDLDYGLGILDDLRFFHRELTPDEICTLTEPETSCLISENFTTNTGFEGVNNIAGNGISVANGRLNFNNVQDGNNTERRLWKNMGQDAPSRFRWNLEFTPQFNNIPAGHLIAITDGNQPIINTVSNNVYTATDQDAIALYPISNLSAPFNYQLAFFVKDGQKAFVYNSAQYYATTWTDAVLTVPLTNIALQNGITHYITVEKFSERSYRLSVFTNPERTIHASGSPACLRIPNSETPNISGLNFLQASNVVQGNPARRLTGSIDNVCINSISFDGLSLQGPLSVCQGASVSFNIVGNQPQEIIWSYPASASLISSNNQQLNLNWGNSAGLVTASVLNGCDTTQVGSIQVGIKPLPNVTISASGPLEFCQGGQVTLQANGAANYVWSTNAITQSITLGVTTNNIIVTGTAANGCKGQAGPLNVKVNPNPVIVASPDVSINPGGSTQLSASGGITYQWSPAGSLTPATGSPVTASPSETTTYTVTGKNQAGCEGSDQVKVTVLNQISPSFTGLKQSYCSNEQPSQLVGTPSGGTFSGPGVNGNTFNPASAGEGTHQITYSIQTVTGAPVTSTQTTVVKLVKRAVFERVICEGESVSYGGKTFNTNGLHEVTIPASNGCDSLIRVYLTVTPASSSTIVRKICAGESVSFGGQSYNQTGIYLLQLPGTAPCHKTYLDLTVLPNNSAEYRRTICAGQSVTYGGETFNSNGVFIIETEAANGCDSTITLYLTVINGETSYVDAEICAGDSYTLPNGNQVNQAGEYPVWVQGDNSNCGSTIITRLKVNPVYNKTVNASINQGETYQLPDGSFVSIAGEYKSNLKTIANCDSIITTKLSVVSPPPAGGCYAVLVKGFKQGNMKNGTPVPAIRSNPAKALFAPEPVVNGVVNFVSLGFGGEITLAFEGPVANGPGNDIRIHEATWNKRTCRNYPEEAEIFASQNACDWIYIGKVCTNGGDLDLGPLSWAQYIKVKDITNKSFSGFPGSADAFDVNAIECLNGPGTIADDGLVAGSIQDVVDYLPGTMKNGGQLPPARKVPAQATGLPGGAGVNFVSLGFGGTFIGRFDYVVFNFPGADLKVLETSYGNPSCANYPEYAHFYGSKDGNSWFDLGVYCQDADIDLGLADWIQYIKVVDESLILSGKFNGAADGYDLDGVATIQPCENSKIELDFSDNVNEADEAYVLSVYPNPIVDQFNVMLEGLENDQVVTVQLTDASGRLVFEKQFSTRGKILSETILAENLPHGIYHLSIRTRGGVWIEKLVK